MNYDILILERNDVMNFNIRGSHVDITEPIRTYIEEKLGKLNKYFDNPNELTANVVVRISGIYQIIEVTIPIKQGIIRGEERNKDLYAAIDLVVEKIERQIRKNKTRSLKRKVESLVPMFSDFETTTEEQSENKIVKRKEIEMKPMDEEEAILQMNLLGHDFYVFKNIETSGISVVYRRKDDDYGLIDTK